MLPNLTKKATASINITEILPNGFGYGNHAAKISLKKQRQDNEITPEVEQKAALLIASGSCVVPVTHKDDGCIDGRYATNKVYRALSGELVKDHIDNLHHRRPLVAGGGAITGRACWIGAKGPGENSRRDLVKTVERLMARHINFGAHTGQHASGENIDCGANDKEQLIFSNIIVFEDKIKQDAVVLFKKLGWEFPQHSWDIMIGQVKKLQAQAAYFVGASGRKNLDIIAKGLQVEGSAPTSVIKELGGIHNEDFIYINLVKDTTFDQALFHEALQMDFPATESLAQIFVVDIWRIQELAEAVGDSEQEKTAAFMAGLAYQLATAATLTDGTLRVFIGIQKSH